MNQRILKGLEDGFMTATLNTNTLRELKVLQKREFQGKKKSEVGTVHWKSWQLLTLRDLLTCDSKCSIPSTANLLQFQSGKRSRAAFSCSSHRQRLIRNGCSARVLHACYRERGCSSARYTALVRQILVSLLVFAKPASTWLKTGLELRQTLITFKSALENVLNHKKNKFSRYQSDIYHLVLNHKYSEKFMRHFISSCFYQEALWARRRRRH